MNGLKFFRNYCYVSTNDLAEKLGVSRNLVTMWENGQKELPDKRADEIAAIFGIDKKYLYEIEEEDILHYVEFCERFYNKEEDSYKVTRGDDTNVSHIINKSFIFCCKQKNMKFFFLKWSCLKIRGYIIIRI